MYIYVHIYIHEVSYYFALTWLTFAAPQSPCFAFWAGVQAACAEQVLQQVLPALLWRLHGPCLELA